MARSPLKVLRDEPDGAGPAPASPEQAAGAEQLAADPKPTRTKVKPTKATVDRISNELTVGIKAVAALWTIRDQHCGPVLNEQARKIAAELAQILAENPTTAAWFEAATGWSTWIKIAVAVGPVADAFVSHHITRDVSRETADEGGDGGFRVEDLPTFHPGERYGAA